MKSFGRTVADLLIEQDMTTAIGNPNWSYFAQTLPGVNYESLRKAVAGEREPSRKIMETVAAALKVEPTVFYEYRLAQAREAFDADVVGLDDALANLEKWDRVAKLLTVVPQAEGRAGDLAGDGSRK